MTTTVMETPAIVDKPQASAVDPQRGACVEFVKFCKEQHLRAQAAETFIRVLHNHAWKMESERIREAMRPEIDKMFAPIERDIARGANCQELLKKLVKLLSEHEMGS
jgi:hypothetical protein